MQIKLCIAIASTLAISACQAKDQDDRFLEQPINEQLVQAERMSTTDVYRIYKKALTVRPGTRSLAEVLSNRGDETRRVLISDITADSQFIYPSHYLPILEGMCSRKRLCYCDDETFKNDLVNALRKHDGYYHFSVQKLDAGDTEFGKACQYSRNSQM